MPTDLGPEEKEIKGNKEIKSKKNKFFIQNRKLRQRDRHVSSVLGQSHTPGKGRGGRGGGHDGLAAVRHRQVVFFCFFGGGRLVAVRGGGGRCGVRLVLRAALLVLLAACLPHLLAPLLAMYPTTHHYFFKYIYQPLI